MNLNSKGFLPFLIDKIKIFIVLINVDELKESKVLLEYVKKALWLCITTLIYIFFVGRFLQILWLAFIALIALVALLIALYGFLYGEKGLRATWWFFAKWGCKILLV
jgi:hypothetical protein